MFGLDTKSLIIGVVLGAIVVPAVRARIGGGTSN